MMSSFATPFRRRWLSRLAIGLGAAAILAPAAANAAWTRAEADRFVVYSDASPADARDYAIKLGEYDAILRLMNPGAAKAPTSQKVNVYLVRDHRELAQVVPGLPPTMAGFYRTDPRAVFAMGYVGSREINADTVLFHEYAHHFMLESFPAAYPSWYVEGWAEYFSTTAITNKDFTVGLYNNNRAFWLEYAKWMPFEELVSKRYSEVAPDDRAMYYPQAWLLMHYFMDTPERAAELDAASRATAAGKDPVKALEAATGKTMAQLTRVLMSYVKVHATTFPITLLKTQPGVSVSTLPASADDLLLDGLRLQVTQPGAKEDALLNGVRQRATRHPGDHLTQLVLARAEFTLGDVAAGEAVVNRLLAENPSDLEAFRLAGEGQVMAGDRRPAERPQRYKAARPYLAKAYQLDPNDFGALYQYARSRTVEANFPTDNDLNILLSAHALAPAVPDASLMAAQALIDHGRRAEAAVLLAPVANNPHGGTAADLARALLAGPSPGASHRDVHEAADKPAAPHEAAGHPG